MKKKIVLWGNDANDEKILVAIELIDADNKVNIHTYPEAATTEEVYNIAMNQWRDSDSIELPEGYTSQERALSITYDLLPEDIKVERTDIIARAKAEWHFIVLSSKLYQMYSSELEDFKEKIDNMSDYRLSHWTSRGPHSKALVVVRDVQDTDAKKGREATKEAVVGFAAVTRGKEEGEVELGRLCLREDVRGTVHAQDKDWPPKERLTN